ncbi:hypothetical protein VTN49DRAFT_3772 [Thermomyces lanuginosus]|uniref:uncharacterized protein n=1 Tax=Thermomyces lanuginosus TaxID=5541 RepID=UPI003743A369
MFSFHTSLLTVLCGLASTVLAVHPLELDIGGAPKAFKDSSGIFVQFMGVGYQPAGKDDPLSDNKDTCLRDAALMQRLGVNAIHIYNVDPSANHDDCASIFNAADIYMIVDVDPGSGLNMTQPSKTYNKEYMKHVFGVMEAFKNYPNTAGFLIREVIDEKSAKEAPEYIRAVQRDMKDYMKKHIGREILVGYSAADVPEALEGPTEYMECDLYDYEKDRKIMPTHADFFAIKSDSWCGDPTYTSSGYDVLNRLRDLSLATIFSDYGCNQSQPRNFSEVQALYGDRMTKALSGGFITEYYDLVTVNSSDTITLSIEYENLQNQLSKLDQDYLAMPHVSPGYRPHPDCIRSPNSSNPRFLTSFHIPERADGVDELIKNGARDEVHVGKLVAMPRQVELSEKVYDSKGNEIAGIKFKNINDSGGYNTPVEYESSSEESEDAAMAVRVSSAAVLGAMIVMVLFLDL